jgi:hypothetical protein
VAGEPCEARFPVTVHIPGIDVVAPLSALSELQPTAKANRIKTDIRFIVLSLISDGNQQDD